jgi:hypothetical protein
MGLDFFFSEVKYSGSERFTLGRLSRVFSFSFNVHRVVVDLCFSL